MKRRKPLEKRGYAFKKYKHGDAFRDEDKRVPKLRGSTYNTRNYRSKASPNCEASNRQWKIKLIPCLGSSSKTG